MLDLAAKAWVRTTLRIAAEECELRAQERCIPRGFHSLRRKIDQADALRAGAVDVIAKSSSQIKAAEFLRAFPLHQQLYARSHGGFGKLKLANIILREGDRLSQHPIGFAVCEASGSSNHSQLQARRHRIHQAAATLTAGRPIPDVPAAQPRAPLLAEDGARGW